MTAMTIELDDAAELAHQDWLAPLPKGSMPLSVREIHLGDARDTGGVFGKVEGVTRNMYGFNPLPARGTQVTNELVNGLREDLGI